MDCSRPELACVLPLRAESRPPFWCHARLPSAEGRPGEEGGGDPPVHVSDTCNESRLPSE